AASNAGEAVAGAASNAANAASNVGSAAVVTSQVKLAIAANKQLNDSANEINVDTKDGKIVLRGHVKTAELKKTAQTIAEKVKKDRSFSETIVNQLTVG
ncbi:BON domain-containing protein, partial [bacterium]